MDNHCMCGQVRNLSLSKNLCLMSMRIVLPAIRAAILSGYARCLAHLEEKPSPVTTKRRRVLGGCALSDKVGFSQDAGIFLQLRRLVGELARCAIHMRVAGRREGDQRIMPRLPGCNSAGLTSGCGCIQRFMKYQGPNCARGGRFCTNCNAAREQSFTEVFHDALDK